jgi:hypothetical protein
MNYVNKKMIQNKSSSTSIHFKERKVGEGSSQEVEIRLLYGSMVENLPSMHKSLGLFSGIGEGLRGDK